MKNLIALIIIGLVIISMPCQAQTVKQDATGNYIAVKTVKDSATAKPTGKTYTDTKGISYPVMVSKNGKLFVIRTSKAGNKYNQYLNL